MIAKLDSLGACARRYLVSRIFGFIPSLCHQQVNILERHPQTLREGISSQGRQELVHIVSVSGPYAALPGI